MDGKSSAASRARRYACNLILHLVICALKHFWCGLFYHLSNTLCCSSILRDSHPSLLALHWIGLWLNWKQIFSTSGSERNQKANPLKSSQPVVLWQFHPVDPCIRLCRLSKWWPLLLVHLRVERRLWDSSWGSPGFLLGTPLRTTAINVEPLF